MQFKLKSGAMLELNHMDDTHAVIEVKNQLLIMPEFEDCSIDFHDDSETVELTVSGEEVIFYMASETEANGLIVAFGQMLEEFTEE